MKGFKYNIYDNMWGRDRSKYIYISFFFEVREDLGYLKEEYEK